MRVIRVGLRFGRKKQSEAVDDERLADNLAFLKSIGLKSLADQIAILRMAQAEHNLNYAEFTIALQELREDRLLSDLMQVDAGLMSSAVQYNNVLIGLGYAGFFALLSLISGLIASADFLISSLFLGLSIFVFVIWNVLQSLLMMRAIRRTANIFAEATDEFDPRRVVEKINLARAERERQFMALNRFWVIFFGISLLSGVLGALWAIASIFVTVLFDGSIWFWLFGLFSLSGKEA